MPLSLLYPRTLRQPPPFSSINSTPAAHPFLGPAPQPGSLWRRRNGHEIPLINDPFVPVPNAPDLVLQPGAGRWQQLFDNVRPSEQGR